MNKTVKQICVLKILRMKLIGNINELFSDTVSTEV
jgi:hypothetical protein